MKTCFVYALVIRTTMYLILSDFVDESYVSMKTSRNSTSRNVYIRLYSVSHATSLRADII